MTYKRYCTIQIIKKNVAVADAVPDFRPISFIEHQLGLSLLLYVLLGRSKAA